MTQRTISDSVETARRTLRRRFEAAEAFVRILAPSDPSLLDDLRSCEPTPAAFAARHPEWYRERWGIVPGPGFDWDSIDVSPWGYVQACLAVRGLAVVVPRDASADEILSRLRGSKAPGASADVDAALRALPPGATTEDALRAVAGVLERTTNAVLVDLLDYLDPGRHLVTAVASRDLAELSRLAREADPFGLGLRDLRPPERAAGATKTRADARPTRWVDYLPRTFARGELRPKRTWQIVAGGESHTVRLRSGRLGFGPMELHVDSELLLTFPKPARAQPSVVSPPIRLGPDELSIYVDSRSWGQLIYVEPFVNGRSVVTGLGLDSLNERRRTTAEASDRYLPDTEAGQFAVFMARQARWLGPLLTAPGILRSANGNLAAGFAFLAAMVVIYSLVALAASATVTASRRSGRHRKATALGVAVAVLLVDAGFLVVGGRLLFPSGG